MVIFKSKRNPDHNCSISPHEYTPRIHSNVIHATATCFQAVSCTGSPERKFLFVLKSPENHIKLTDVIGSQFGLLPKLLLLNLPFLNVHAAVHCLAVRDWIHSRGLARKSVSVEHACS